MNDEPRSGATFIVHRSSLIVHFPLAPHATSGCTFSFMWKVGQLAKRTGISVRTLHHYDQIGLLTPSHRTESGHRLYDDGDVARLQQIVSLRQLGFALDAIRDLLHRPGTSLVSVLDMHLAHLRG